MGIVELGMERRQTSRARICPAGRLEECGPRAMLDHRDMLDGGFGSRVRTLSPLGPCYVY